MENVGVHACSRRITEGRGHYLSVELTVGMLGRRKTIINLKRYEVKKSYWEDYNFFAQPTGCYVFLCHVFKPI